LTNTNPKKHAKNFSSRRPHPPKPPGGNDKDERRGLLDDENDLLFGDDVPILSAGAEEASEPEAKPGHRQTFFDPLAKAGPERAMLVGAKFRGTPRADRENSDLPELARLATSAGARVLSVHEASMSKVNAACYITRDKLATLVEEAKNQEVNLVIFDEALSPNQQRTLQEEFSCKVIDRPQLILDIFAQRARTSEGKLQVELAQLNYMLPRLRGMWKHLERQGGGIGTRGPGEREIETDRRRVRDRIARLERDLGRVRSTRGTQRRKRQRAHLPSVALVGYTNAGKSSLLNALTSSRVETRDQLFATLDPSTRACDLPRGTVATLSDTVGFVNKLPHQLVAAFRATLEELTYADLLLLVVDAASENIERDVETTRRVINELGAGDKPIIMVWNKVDAIEDFAALRDRASKYRCSAFVSAITGEGLDELRVEMERQLETRALRLEVALPYGSEAYRLVARLHEDADVVSVDYSETRIAVVADMPAWLAKECAGWAGATVSAVADRPGIDLDAAAYGLNFPEAEGQIEPGDELTA
jgi:GTP-binding protein HflX